jgi:hypothetical protein
MARSSTGLHWAITLIRVVGPSEITPEPEEDERKAILAALAADEAARPAGSEWADALLPVRDDEDGAPYLQ